MVTPPFRSEHLHSGHDREGFSCGVDQLDHYLRRQASQDQRRSIAMPYVLVETASGTLAGYYTISAYGIDISSLPPDVTKKLPRYPTLPAFLIGRLALDRRYQHKGLGRILLVDALGRCLTLSEQIAAMAVVVEAKDEDARTFYEHIGFLRLLDDEFRLYLPMGTVAKLFKGIPEAPNTTSTQPR